MQQHYMKLRLDNFYNNEYIQTFCYFPWPGSVAASIKDPWTFSTSVRVRAGLLYLIYHNTKNVLEYAGFEFNYLESLVRHALIHSSFLQKEQQGHCLQPILDVLLCVASIGFGFEKVASLIASAINRSAKSTRLIGATSTDT